MKRIVVFSIVLLAIALSGCAHRPLVVDYFLHPPVRIQTNLPLARQGVIVTNAVRESGVLIRAVKTGYYGQSIIVRNMSPGVSYPFMADAFLLYQTMTVTVTAYDTQGRYLCAASREFSFYNSGYQSQNQHWDFQLRDCGY